ncbi:hypothetical protein KW797_02705 [Candidatus Parcubacteria bacterium]|nr:hypothetical protein [Candidatus Parcubacteria bacterium]
MIYRRDSFEREERRGRYAPLFIFALIVGVFFLWTSMAERAGNLALRSVAFLLGDESALVTNLRAIGTIFSDKEALMTENERLAGEVTRLQELANSAEGLAAENERLAALLDGKGKHTIVAPILVAPNRSPYDTFVVGAGSDRGVREGADVFAGNSLIGSVEAVSPRSARIALFSSPGKVFAARINAVSPVEVAGRGGGSFEAVVPRGTGIKEGDAVTVPALERISIGTVAAVLTDARDPLEKLLILSPVSFASLTDVEIAL